MELNNGENDLKAPKRSSLLRHNRTTSDLQKSSDGLKTVNSVTGAIQNFFKWSSSPLAKDKKARSFDSLQRANSQDSVDSFLSEESTKTGQRNSFQNSEPNKMEKRRSSGNLTRSSPVISKDNSPDVIIGASYHDNRDGAASSSSSSLTQNQNVAFTVSDGSLSQSRDQGNISDSANTGGAGFGTPSRKSTDSSDSQKGNDPNMDLREKSFEKSLNNILNKCSETSLDLTVDSSKGDDSTLKAGKGDRKKKSSPWYTMLSPTYKSRSEDFKRQFKDIPADERLIVDYSCALQKEILVHGRMFVTQNWICFYANIFRWETVVTIPTKEICAITKEKTARVIPNAIQITTEKEKCFFTSLTARDKTFMMLFRLWQNALMEQPMPPQELWHWVHSSYGEELGLTSSDDDYVPPPSLSEGKDGMNKDSSIISKGDSSDMLPTSDIQNLDEEGDSTQADISLDDFISAPLLNNDDKEPTDLSDNTEEDVSEGEVVCSEHDHFARLAHNEVYQMPVDKLFELMFTDCDFFRHFTRARKLQDVTISPWRDDPDENIGRVREVTYTLPLNAPFGPKTSYTVEKHSCYKQSQPGVLYVIDADCTPMGIPYADAFYVVNRYCMTRVSKEKSRLRVTSEVKYRKSVWGVVKSIHLRKETERLQKIQGIPATSKRKIRKRRAHVIRSANTPGELPSTSRSRSQQMSRSHTTEKMIAPTTPVRNIIAVQKEEKLLKMNADTLVRIVCFILVLLVMFNALLFYKLWSLETMANVLYFPHSQDTINSIAKHPPKSHDEWVHLLNQQQHLHDREVSKWKDLLETSISLIDHMKNTLTELKDHVENTSKYSSGPPS